MLNHLALVPGTSPEFRAWFWEPAVDGRLLRELFRPDLTDQGPAGQYIPVLVHSWPVGMTDDVRVLLGEMPAELPSGRVPIYVCPQCGDLGCGAVTAVIERTPDTVVWRDFGWDVNYETDDDDDSSLITAGPFVFDRAQHDAELRRFIDTFNSVRRSLPPPPPTPSGPVKRRRWRWPRDSQ